MHSKCHGEPIANAIAKPWRTDGIDRGIVMGISSNSTSHGIATSATRAIVTDAMRGDAQ